jgi:hypothetical protein
MRKPLGKNRMWIFKRKLAGIFFNTLKKKTKEEKTRGKV